MPTNQADFERMMGLETSALLRRLDEQYRNLVLEIMRRIIERTPVDTSNAQGQWQLIVQGDGVPQVLSMEEGINRDAFPEIRQAARNLKVVQSVLIVNNAKYISFLEDGSSRQAPAGMVALTFAEFENLVIS